MIRALSVKCDSIKTNTTIGELVDEKIERLQKCGYDIIDVKLISVGDRASSVITALILYDDEVTDNN